jgi:ribosomal protein S12 methylthiotransferase
MKKTLLHLMTLGCPKNQVDSRQIQGMLLEKGYAFTDSPQDAEIIFLNTCGFVDEAKEESIQAILELSRWKQEGRLRFLVVLGCLVQKYGRELAAALPEVDLFLGVTDWVKLQAHIEGLLAGPGIGSPRKKRVQVGSPSQHLFSNQWALHGPEEPAGYVKIAEGCNHHCTFCVIPQIRGAYRSRPPESIRDEVAARVARGLREAILIAQDTGPYGKDLAPASSLAELLRELCAIDGLERLRIMYCYPEGVDAALLEAMKHPKVCPYLDMPLQHVDDGLLRRMARPQSSGQLKAVIAGLREAIPDIVIRTTLMVGFPGETPEAFQALLDFLAEYRLERVGFFAFSPQPGTPAAKLPDQIPEKEKERRLALAQQKQSEILAQWQSSLIGRVLPVFIDERAAGKAGLWDYEGRTCWDAPEIDGLVAFSGRARCSPGQSVKVRITHSRDYLLSGEIADESCQ